MATKFVMALDAGTTSNRAIIFDSNSKVIGVSQKEFTQHFPEPGWVEHDAEVSACGYMKFTDKDGKEYARRVPSEWFQEFNAGIQHLFMYTPCAKIIKKELIDRCHLRFSVGEQLEDAPYNCLLYLLAERVTIQDGLLYHYRVYEDSTMGSIRRKDKRPRPPYHGVEQMILDFRKHNTNPDREKVMEYCAIKILTGFVTNMYAKTDNQTRREICVYCHRIMRTYFPDALRNPYLGVNCVTRLPLSHRVAVLLFVLFDRLNALYFLSASTSLVLKGTE